jgi:hypothetical protein
MAKSKAPVKSCGKYDPEAGNKIRGATWPGQKQIKTSGKKK